MFLLNTSCIHSGSVQTKDVQTDQPKESVFHTSSTNSLQISDIVYSKAKFPLEDFFSSLMSGQFKESIQKMNLKYKPSNVSNSILEKLLDHGYVPAYVKIKNTSQLPVKISYENFQLVNLENANTKWPAIDSKQLPQQFNETASGINPEGAAVVVVAVVFVAVILFVVAVASQGGGNVGSFPNFGGGGSGSGPEVYKTVTHVTKLNYQDLLIDEKIILPDQEIVGLIFFKLPQAHRNSDLQLQYQLK